MTIQEQFRQFLREMHSEQRFSSIHYLSRENTIRICQFHTYT